MKPLSGRALGLKPSQTVAIDARYKALKASGADVVSLAAGEPDFDTPGEAKAAAMESIRRNLTRYSAPTGLPELREALAARLRRDGLDYAPDEIVVCAGAKPCVFNALLALCGPGDEVLIPSPFWVTYPELARFAGASPVALQTRERDGFKLLPRDLEAALTPRSKCLILNSPCNPTGAVYTPEETAALAEIAARRDLYCISDEIYAGLLYGGAVHRSPAAMEGMRSRTVIVNGFSKSHAMTGWRLGWLAAPAGLAAVIGSIQGQTTHHPANVSQYAALGALRAGDGFTRDMRAALEIRRAHVLERLGAMPGVRAVAPDGAFYVFLSVREILQAVGGAQGRPSSLDLCGYLLDAHGLAVVPGEGFGAEGYLRLSFACSQNSLDEGLQRLARGLAGFGSDPRRQGPARADR